MNDVPKGLRRHIAIAGRRNVGKSSLLNALAGQTVSIVTPEAGATTDPVEKTMELPPLGPVVLIDTAGLDDEGELGMLRVERSRQILSRADAVIIVTEREGWGEEEMALAHYLKERHLPYIVARNKMEDASAHASEDAQAWRRQAGLGRDALVVDVSARTGAGLEKLIARLASIPGMAEMEKPLLHGLARPGGLVLLVAPQDSGAPKGRLILPQAQTIRAALDEGMMCLTVNDTGYAQSLKALARKPDFVICDSRVALNVASLTAPDLPLTTFSILLARAKGDLEGLARGAAALLKLKPGDKVLIQEACSHHPQKDDIGRVKIPGLLRKMAGGELDTRFAPGKEITGYDTDLKAIVHCGACVITRAQMLARQMRAPCAMTNYGMAISLGLGILPRLLALFPTALASYEKEARKSEL